jgi:hypothetical protein
MELNWTKIYRFIMIGGLAFIINYITLQSDNHNDSRYVQQVVYIHDRQTDKELREAKDSAVNQQLEQHLEFLKSIDADVKTLLSRDRK